MTYLIGEMLVSLLLAAAIGFAAAWILRGIGRGAHASGQSDAAWASKVTALEAEYEANVLAAEAANARLRADLHAARSHVAALEGDGGQRNADLETALKTQIRAAEALAEERGHALEQLRAAFQAAHNEWRDRVAAVEDQNAALAEALENAQQRQTPEADSDLAAALQRDNTAKAELISGLERALSAAEAELGHAQIRIASAETMERDLQRRIADLEAALASSSTPRRSSRTAPPEGEDDLQALTGIGPVFERALKAQGIVTYRILANLTPEEAAEIGRRMKNNFADRYIREKWAEQARAQHIARYGEEP